MVFLSFDLAPAGIKSRSAIADFHFADAGDEGQAPYQVGTLGLRILGDKPVGEEIETSISRPGGLNRPFVILIKEDKFQAFKYFSQAWAG